MKKIFIIFSLFSIFLFSQDKIVAIVGNKPIFETDVIKKSKIDNLPYSISLKQLIEEKLLLCQAEKKGIEIKNEEIKSEIEKFKKNFPSLKDFYAYLKKIDMPITQLENEIAKSLKIRKLIKTEIIDKIEISPVEIANEFEKIKGEMSEYEFYFKWFDNKEECEKFIENFNQEELNKMEYAKLKSTEIIEEILSEITKTKKGNLTGPIEINKKWVVVYLKDKNQIEMDKYEKYREVKDRIFKTKYSILYKNYIEEIKKSIPVELF